MMPLMRVLSNRESVDFEDVGGQYRVRYGNTCWDDGNIFALIAACPTLKQDAESLAEIIFFLFLQQHHVQINAISRSLSENYKVSKQEIGEDDGCDSEGAEGVGALDDLPPPVIANGTLVFYVMEKEGSPGEPPQPIVVRAPLAGPRVTWARRGAAAALPEPDTVVAPQAKQDKNCILM